MHFSRFTSSFNSAITDLKHQSKLHKENQSKQDKTLSTILELLQNQHLQSELSVAQKDPQETIMDSNSTGLPTVPSDRANSPNQLSNPAAPRELLELVPNLHGANSHSYRDYEGHRSRGSWAGENLHVDNEDNFGDSIKIKEPNTLRIGFQNIGGLPLLSNKHKDDVIRCGITKWDFDIFGIAETNVD
jgi:hypothetical protein